MASDNGNFLGAFGRISDKFSEVFGVSKPKLDQVLTDTRLRRSGKGLYDGLELMLPGGKVLAVEGDEVGKTIERVHMLFLGKALKVTGIVDSAGGKIRIKKIEAHGPRDLPANNASEA